MLLLLLIVSEHKELFFIKRWHMIDRVRLDQIVIKREKSRSFFYIRGTKMYEQQISEHHSAQIPVLSISLSITAMSDLGTNSTIIDWLTLNGTNLRLYKNQISVHFGLASQNLLKPDCEKVPDLCHLTNFLPKSEISGLKGFIQGCPMGINWARLLQNETKNMWLSLNLILESFWLGETVYTQNWLLNFKGHIFVPFYSNLLALSTVVRSWR